MKFKKPYIIAEIGSNFNQNLETGYNLIKQAKICGADAVKFQLFKAKILYPNNKKMFKIFKSIELSHSMFKSFFKFAKKLKLDVSASVFDEHSAKFLSKFSIDFNKLASSEISNLKLLNFLSKIKKPILISTGMSNLKDVQQAVQICEKNKNKNIVILQCGSLYPLPISKVNLNSLKTYLQNFNYILGFSDHTLDDVAAITSIGLGARVFEKHITLDKKSEGPDHFYAMEPKQFKNYVTRIRKAYLSLGNKKKDLLPEEKTNSRREGMYYKKNLKKDEKISKKDIFFKRPPLGLTPAYLNEITNRYLKRNVKKNSPIFIEDFKNK